MRLAAAHVLLLLLLLVASRAEADETLEALFGGAKKNKKKGQLWKKTTPMMSVANLSAAVAGWTGTDVAVLYYSPYGDAGTYSRQVMPLWDEMWAWHAKKRTKGLTVAKFNCESTLAHQELCFDAGVRQYPTLAFYGYSRLSFGRGPRSRSTTYRGLALSESVRDWSVLMHWLSLLQRASDRLLCFLGLGGRSPEAVQLQSAKRHELETIAEYERRLADANVRLAETRRELQKARRDDDTEGASSIWDDLLKGLAADFDDDKKVGGTAAPAEAKGAAKVASPSSSTTAATTSGNANNNNNAGGGKKQNTKLSPKKQRATSA